jgi:metallopeptidase family M12-like protein
MNLIKTVLCKNCLATILLSILIVSAVAQKPRRSVLYNLVMQKRAHGVVFQNLSIFTRNHHDFHLTKDNRAGAIGTGLTLNQSTITALLRARHEAIVISIPSADGTIYTLDLTEQKINVSGDFSFGTINKEHKRLKTSSDQGLHYRGFVEGDSTSFATVSFFTNGDMMGLFSNAMGNFNIGKADSAGTNYVVYNANDMALSSTFQCNTLDVPPSVTANFPSVNSSPPPLAADTPVPALLCKKVRVYLEGSYSLYWYNFHSDLTATQNYLTGLFNQVSAMYENEGIMVELASTYVWTTPDPYDSTQSANALTQFQTRWNNLGDDFDGDIAQLVFGGANPVKGGIAYLLPDLCIRNYCYSYSNVFGTYNSVPTYSWDVNVVTHEMGHLLGSHHTHWCGWNTGPGGTCGAIDNCYTEENLGSGCNSCPALTDTATRPPGWQGTVMSYCHIDYGIGINLANGFGPLPQAVIRSQVSSATCLAGTVESWSGTTSTAWEDPANWSCGTVPDTNTDVTIGQGAPNMPVVNSNAQCHSLTAPSGTTIQVNDGESLNVAGAGPVQSP